MKKVIRAVTFSLQLQSGLSFQSNRLYEPAVQKASLNAEPSSRRKTFGELVGAAFLPVAIPEVSNAADEYPFKMCLNKLAKTFPEAVTNTDLVAKVTKSLRRFGYDDKALVAFSLCSDEVNRPLEDIFSGWYGDHFNMGGLAGFPMAGLTGFGAMASHVPDNGSCLLVYGPHVGIDMDGRVGKVDRKGKDKSGSCCGSAIYASKYVTAVYRGDVEKVSPPTDFVDAQQNFVASSLLPYGGRVANAPDPMVELPFATFEPIDAMMERIVRKAGKGVGNGRIAMLGGIQINTPRGLSDYFLPLRFDIRESSGEIIEDLMWTRKVGSETRRRTSA